MMSATSGGGQSDFARAILELVQSPKEFQARLDSLDKATVTAQAAQQESDQRRLAAEIAEQAAKDAQSHADAAIASLAEDKAAFEAWRLSEQGRLKAYAVSLDKRSADLDQASADFDAAKVGFTEKRAALDAREAALVTRDLILAAQDAAMTNRADELDAKSAELDEKLARLKAIVG